MATEITARKEVNGEKKEVTIVTDLGENLADAVAKFGEDVVFSNFCQSAVITAQAAMRRGLEKGKTNEEIVGYMAGWKPGVQLQRQVDPLGALLSRVDKMSDEEKAAIIEQLMAKLQSPGK